MAPARDPSTGRFMSSGGGGSGGGGFNLGTAVGSIVIDMSGVHSAMSEAKNAIVNGVQGIGNSMQGVGDQIAGIGSSLTMLTAPLAAAGGVGLKAAADFDVLLKQIEIFGGVAPENMETVRKFALDMGAQTKFSSGEAASALLDLLKSGQSLEQGMATLKPVLDLAAAGEMGLSQAAGVVSSALAIFNLKAEDANRVSNALAKAANASRADVADLGAGLSNVGGVATMFNLSVEETSAILGVFSNRGIEASEAGTQLKSMLLALNRDTEDAKAAWSELGVSMYDTQGNMRNFDTVIDELDAALDKLPVEEQNRLMQQLGGSFGIVGLNALRAEGGIDTMLSKMNEAPEAATIAEAFMDTFKGSVESLLGSVETLMIQGLTPLMNDILAPMVQQITEVVNSVTEWMQANPELTATIVKVLAVIVALGPALLIAGKAIAAVGVIVSGFGSVLGFILSPIGLIIAAVVGLYLAFQNNFLGIRDLLQPVIDNIVMGVETLVGVFGNFGNIVANQGLGQGIASVINAFMQMLGLVENDQMSPLAEQMGNSITGAFISIATFINDSVLPALQALAQWFIAN